MNGDLPATPTHPVLRLSLVVAGGGIAEKCVRCSMPTRIHWIPSTVTDELANLARGGKIEWLPRACRSADRAALTRCCSVRAPRP